ncbi:adenosylmethionine--8-amino-7-oxononanoate transaminase [Derxia gummosa]|uniref:Adenosylmethionine-8-amino-7-oxononanoate aminotransferase n=1 Tax=Derxia gummosa DSM 723 TaxID=1121388 RepID=A0A8B6X0G6_9BURK|nr:adenosylmethionine--8-amino-7-oxononanoate transaminase [Derxia gummosa]
MTVPDWLALDRAHCWHPFTQARTAPVPLAIVRGEGAWLHAADGRRYLDAVSSWWVNLHGHAHPAIAEAIAEQARTLPHTMFAGITHEPAARLAAELVARAPAPLSHVFFSDNGSTAIEVALKIACQYWINQGQKRHRFLAFEGGYHGDTFGAMAAGRSSGFYAPFEDWLFSVDFMPWPQTWIDKPGLDDEEAAVLARLDAWLDRHGHELAAFVFEPLVQGASGMRMARAPFLRTVCEKVRACGVPVIFDEVMTGFGRTGRMFAAEHIGFTPDLLCLCKGLTGGFLPMAVTLATPAIHDAFLGDGVDRALLHGHTFTANPLGCAAALASLRLFDSEDTMQRIASLEAMQAQRLAALASHPLVSRSRQWGTIAAFDLVPAGAASAGYGSASGRALREAMIARGVLMRPMGDAIYVLPPYCISVADLDFAYGQLREVLDELAGADSRGVGATDLF